VLGTHVLQRGSLVAPDRLRFDFSHPRPMTPDEVRAVEEQVNAAILQDIDVVIEERPYARRSRSAPWRCSARSTATSCASSWCRA
jgi:alanyl-tRNA synthetase